MEWKITRSNHHIAYHCTQQLSLDKSIMHEIQAATITQTYTWQSNEILSTMSAYRREVHGWAAAIKYSEFVIAT